MKVGIKKQIALPQDHGSWVFILSPLLIGMVVAQRISFATVTLSLAALSAFLIRQPVTVIVKVLSGRRPKSDLTQGLLWVLFYGSLMVLSLLDLVVRGFGYVLYLAIPGLPIFGWHLWRVSRRSERKQAGIEVLATGVLSLSAPAAYWVGLETYDPRGWWLWLLIWLQSASSIVYAYLRLEQRERAPGQAKPDLWISGRRALFYTSFNLAFALLLGWTNIIPPFIFFSFLLQWLETLWGIAHPAYGWKPTRIGIRQLIVSSLWTILFLLTWSIP